MQNRYFLAIDINDHVKMNVKVAQRHVKGREGDVKVVEAKNLHFTVRFLGNLSGEQVKRVIDALKPLLEDEISSNVSVQGLGFFGAPNVPRVIWAGVSQGKSYIEGLFARISKKLDEIGLKTEEKEVFPHITIARVRSEKNINMLKEIISKERESFYGETLVDAVKLKSSTLTPEGPVYSDVAVFPLRKL
ncbi:MAG: RNA 2',3'-cyclic phosphodiesterase [Candidatus Aenigmarchaeota archaeon]|nr:RNA 2',3'-cyclic phosphodiesterase [Candidatus Aenigmarchaeota archaeon]